MIVGLQAVVAPLLTIVEARLRHAAEAAIRRAVLTIAATLFGVGALLFLSVGVFFGLMPGLGASGAALILALIWALLAGLCYVLSLLRPRRVARPLALPRAMAPPVAPFPAAAPVAPVGVQPPPTTMASTMASTIAARSRFETELRRAAPGLALGALIAGFFASRR